MDLPVNPLESFRKRNPHLYLGAAGGNPAAKQEQVGCLTAAPSVRIRQDSKPLLNKLEKEWFDILKAGGNVTNLSAQALRFKLANGAWYKCDIVGWVNGRLTGWECKGPSCVKNVDRGILTVKIAAAQWPEVDFYLVWKERGQFRQQHVLP